MLKRDLDHTDLRLLAARRRCGCGFLRSLGRVAAPLQPLFDVLRRHHRRLDVGRIGEVLDLCLAAHDLNCNLHLASRDQVRPLHDVSPEHASLPDLLEGAVRAVEPDHQRLLRVLACRLQCTHRTQRRVVIAAKDHADVRVALQHILRDFQRLRPQPVPVLRRHDLRTRRSRRQRFLESLVAGHAVGECRQRQHRYLRLTAQVLVDPGGGKLTRQLPAAQTVGANEWHHAFHLRLRRAVVDHRYAFRPRHVGNRLERCRVRRRLDDRIHARRYQVLAALDVLLRVQLVDAQHHFRAHLLGLRIEPFVQCHLVLVLKRDLDHANLDPFARGWGFCRWFFRFKRILDDLLLTGLLRFGGGFLRCRSLTTTGSQENAEKDDQRDCQKLLFR